MAPSIFRGLLLAVYPDHAAGLVVDGTGRFALIPVAALRQEGT